MKKILLISLMTFFNISAYGEVCSWVPDSLLLLKSSTSKPECKDKVDQVHYFCIGSASCVEDKKEIIRPAVCQASSDSTCPDATECLSLHVKPNNPDKLTFSAKKVELKNLPFSNSNPIQNSLLGVNSSLRISTSNGKGGVAVISVNEHYMDGNSSESTLFCLDQFSKDFKACLEDACLEEARVDPAALIMNYQSTEKSHESKEPSQKGQ